MHITFKGEDLGEWKGAPRLKEARQIKHRLGLLPQAFMQAVSEFDPDALCFLVSLMYARNGKVMPYEEIDGELQDFGIELTDEEKREQTDREVGVLSPAIVAALKELGVNPSAAHVTEVVQRHLEEAARKAEEEGKDDLLESPASTTSPAETTSTNTESSTT